MGSVIARTVKWSAEACRNEWPALSSPPPRTPPTFPPQFPTQPSDMSDLLAGVLHRIVEERAAHPDRYDDAASD